MNTLFQANRLPGMLEQTLLACAGLTVGAIVGLIGGIWLGLIHFTC